MNKWIKKHFIDIALIFILTITAALPRLILLDSIPGGLHGDEAWTGLDAREIVAHGYVGPYVTHALGQPIGPLYWTAFVFRHFGDSIYFLRWSMAVFGIVTIPLFYILMRLFVHKAPATLASLAFSFSLIHLHFSRMGFMVISAPVFQIAALISLFLATRKKDNRSFAISGIFTGLGIYTYNAFILFPLTLLTHPAFAMSAFTKKTSTRNHMLFFLVAFILILLPLIDFFLKHPIGYLAHFLALTPFVSIETSSVVSLYDSPYTFILNAVANITHYIKGGAIDMGDSFGAYYTFFPVSAGLMLYGITASVKKGLFRKDFQFLALSLLIVSFGLVLTTEGVYRRNILMLSYLYFFAGVGIQMLMTVSRSSVKQVISWSLIFLITVECLINLNTYFGLYARDGIDRFLFGNSLREVSTATDKLIPDDYHLYFLSSRWPCTYETVRYLDPHHACEDRSAQFGTYSLSVPTNEKAAFILLDSYILKEQELLSLYPESTVWHIMDEDRMLGVIVMLEN